MPKIKVLTDKPYYMNVPEWFMNNRANGVQKFSEQEGCWLANEIPAYTQIKKFMLNFPKTSVFLDVGAQMGLCTLPIAAEGYDVIAVEPVLSNVSLLNQNVIQNDIVEKVDILPFAAHAKEMKIDIYVPTEEDCASLSESAALKIGKPVTPQSILAIALDDHERVREREKDISFIKIDVQGAEIDVLRGLKKTLSQPTRRYVYIEWDPGYMRNYGSTPEEMHELFREMGYRRISPELSHHEFNGDALYTN